MSSSGPNYPSTASSSASAPESANAWTNPTNVGSDNATYADITAATYDSPDISERLLAQGFGFSIPAGATVDGVVVEIDRYCGAGSAADYRVQLLNDSGTIFGDNKSSASAWPGSAAIATYGASTDGWNGTLTPTIINSANFGVALSVKANSANTDIYVDFIRVTVYYTYAGTTVTGAAALSGDGTLAAVGGYVAPSVFSDGFETNDLSRWTTISQGQGTAYVSASAAKNGSFGIVISELSTYTQAGPNLRKTVVSTNTARMSGWFYTVTDGPSGNNNANLRLFSGGTRIVDVYRQNITGGLWLRYLDGAAASKFLQLAADGYATTAQWYQIDAYIKYAGAGSVSTIIAWVDGSQVLSRTDISLNKGSYDMLQIGAEHVSQHVNTWSDDIYINTAPSDPSGSTVTGAASLTADATLAAAASITLSGAAALSAAATLAAAGGLTLLGASALAGEATLAASGTIVISGGTVTAVASLSTLATLAATAGVVRGAAATLDGTATIASTAGAIRGAAASLTGGADVAAAAGLILGAIASLSADATLASAARRTLGFVATLDGTATIAPTAGVTYRSGASLAAQADLTAVGFTNNEPPSGPPPVGTVLLLKIGR